MYLFNKFNTFKILNKFILINSKKSNINLLKFNLYLT